MAKRVRIGLIYDYNENWIGGTYYRLNFIRALNTLNDNEKPLVYIFGSKKLLKEVKSLTSYTFLKNWGYIPNFFKRQINKLSKHIFKRNTFDIRPTSKNFDFIFANPWSDFFDLIPSSKKIFWIPDFQEKYYPEFFPHEDLIKRKEEQEIIAQNGLHVVFSSNNALEDFNELYPDNLSKQRVIPFAVTIGNEYQKIPDKIILEQYNLKTDFVIVPNQFWRHKNHKVVIDAFELISNRPELNLQCVFTGKEHDHRYPEYAKHMKSEVKLKRLENCIQFLGFIPRMHLLKLISLAKAVIQPSLFEGWSTVVEDGKAINKHIIASSIGIHKEQLVNYPSYQLFNPSSKSDLVDCLLKIKNEEEVIYDYDSDIKKFSRNILDIVNFFN